LVAAKKEWDALEATPLARLHALAGTEAIEAHVFALADGVIMRLPSRNPGNHLFAMVVNPRLCKRPGRDAVDQECRPAVQELATIVARAEQ
jgi:hypothetical protein